MPPSTVDERLRGDYEVNTTGEPDALKGARPVRKGTERKGLATAPRSQSTLHQKCFGRYVFSLADGEINMSPLRSFVFLTDSRRAGRLVRRSTPLPLAELL